MDLSQQPILDELDEPDPELNRITNAIIGACIEVHRHLGAGYLESYYERALEKEFKLRGIQFSRQYRLDVSYKERSSAAERLTSSSKERSWSRLRPSKRWRLFTRPKSYRICVQSVPGLAF